MMMKRDMLRHLILARKRRVLYHRFQALPSVLIERLLSVWERQEGKQYLDDAIQDRQGRLDFFDKKHIENLQYDQRLIFNLFQKYDGNIEISNILDIIENCIETNIKKARLSCLACQQIIPMHIDDPAQNRYLVALKGTSNFIFQVEEAVTKLIMKPGDIVFVNTAWQHSVESLGTEERITLLIDGAEGVMQ